PALSRRARKKSPMLKDHVVFWIQFHCSHLRGIWLSANREFLFVATASKFLLLLIFFGCIHHQWSETGMAQWQICSTEARQ
ncbi:MAG TPA: hypothetical protein VHK27_08875, partial [Gammaproteobacteria bacterium]|nr:hypothetical protein [Gammaproteobacteria bacterium]